MRLGFVGTGAIASAIVTGLSEDCADPPSILLSPRNARISAGLASRFPSVAAAPTNQAVLDGSEIVMLSVRPQIAVETLSSLKFRPDHHVVSLIATFSLEGISALVAPARKITRAVPLPSVAQRQGPTAIFPPDRAVADLFGRIGFATEVQSAAEFDAYCATTATMASHFAFAETVSSWLTRHGAAPDAARRYVGAVFQGLAHTTAASPERSFAALAMEHTTLGGINEQVLNLLTERGAFSDLSVGLDAVLRRFTETAH